RATPPAAGGGEHDRLTVWLVTGSLPWWADRLDARSLFAAFVERLQRPDGGEWLRGILREHPAAIRRLALQWDMSRQIRALEIVWPQTWPAAAPFLKAISNATGTSGNHEDREATLVEAVWQLWAGERPFSPLVAELAGHTTPAHHAGERRSVHRVAHPAVAETAESAPASSGVQFPALAGPDDLRAKSERLWALLREPSPTARRLATMVKPGGDRDALREWHARVLPELATQDGAATPPPEPASPRTETVKPGDGPTPVGPKPERLLTVGPGPKLPAELAAGSTATDGSKAGAAAHQAGRPSPAPLPVDRPDRHLLEVRDLLAPGLPVASAGLVLIAPYLPPFLAAVDLLPASGVGDPDPGASGVPLLLHWLATGSAEAAEPELALPKLLAGMPLDEPVVCRRQFPSTSLAEAERLLLAVIAHWSALKETSVEGLRDAFLQRAGLLRDDGSQWLLRVEHRAWDVLLERVPWTFRTLRLPWMERALQVEWGGHA
ncbi:MAG: hypothetical protein KDM81_14975, partial [Verrucomicrobiae bacterium]|nr:hypothetical protein [Verrucomicrobiae bacterium]